MAASTFLMTYQDVVDHITAFMAGSTLGTSQQAVRSAIETAYREVTTARRWTYLQKVYQLNITAPITTGTIAYDHTGGATCERQLTLTDATWPSWADQALVRIGNVNYSIAAIESSTVVQLDSNRNPGADVAADTDYTLYRCFYTMPADFVAADEFMTELTPGGARYITPAGFMGLDRFYYQSGIPSYYTFMGDPAQYGRLAFGVWPVPDADQTLHFMYFRRPRDLKLDGVAERLRTGKASVTTGTQQVTGDATNFRQDMIGSVIRIGIDANLPTASTGDNPWVEQHVISDVTDTLNLTIDQAAGDTLTGCGYTISDPIDLEVGMIDAFLRGAEYQVGGRRHRKDQAMLLQEYARAMQIAKEGDSRSMQTRFAGESVIAGSRLAYWSRPGIVVEV